jgi:hypothetical protein
MKLASGDVCSLFFLLGINLRLLLVCTIGVHAISYLIRLVSKEKNKLVKSERWMVHHLLSISDANQRFDEKKQELPQPKGSGRSSIPVQFHVDLNCTMYEGVKMTINARISSFLIQNVNRNATFETHMIQFL